jgi:uridine kinase
VDIGNKEMGVQLPYIIGITGPSCSGKSWLADRLHQELGKSSGRLSMDDFYLDRSHLPEEERGRCNFDDPAAIDWDRLERTLADFAAGRAASAPKYDFTTHCRRPEEAQLTPTPIILMDGLWLFQQESIRKWFHLKIFIHADQDLCRERRLQRDATERGRTAGQALEQFLGTVAPMQEKHVLPQKIWADIQLKAPIPEQEVQGLLHQTRNILSQKPTHL